KVGSIDRRIGVVDTANFVFAVAVGAIGGIHNSGLQRLAVDAAEVLNRDVVVAFGAGIRQVHFVNLGSRIGRFLQIVRAVAVVAGGRRADTLLNALGMDALDVSIERVGDANIGVLLERDLVMAGGAGVREVFCR